MVSLIFLILIITAGILQIQYGIIIPQRENKIITKLGEDDFSLDMYGWKQLSNKFSDISERDIKSNIMSESAPIITFRWFPAAHFDYYLARKLHKNVFALGDLNSIRNYGWVNQQRGNFSKGENAYYISSSRDYRPPETTFKDIFTEIETADTIRIYRNGENVMNYFVFRMKGLRRTINFSSFF